MISKAQISFIKSLQQKKHRQESKKFIAEGIKLIEELIQSNFEIEHIYTVEEKYDSLFISLSKVSKNIEISIVSHSELERITALQSTPDILAIVNITEPDPLLLNDKNWFKNNLALVLDEVKDPGNMGTIIRIADWFNIKRIICSEQSVDIYNSKVVQSSMGSIFRVEVFYKPLDEFVSRFTDLPIYGAVLNGNSIYQEELLQYGLIVLGSESHGISEPILKLINREITIPSTGAAESLNVAVATAIICSEFRRKAI